MRRQDLITVYYANGMHRSVKRHSPIPSPFMGGLLHQMNVQGQVVVQDDRS